MFMLRSVCSSTANATGNNINVVAVLEIHMLRTADAAMKPSTRPRALPPPKIFTIYKAIRRCAPESDIAVDNMKPPISKRMSGLPNAWPTWAGVNTPNKGNSASGISEVNGMGTGSNTHQVAHSKVTEAVMAAACDQPCPVRSRKSPNAATGPMSSSQRVIDGSQLRLNLSFRNCAFCRSLSYDWWTAYKNRL
jgi:hypothetical protein